MIEHIMLVARKKVIKERREQCPITLKNLSDTQGVPEQWSSITELLQLCYPIWELLATCGNSNLN